MYQDKREVGKTIKSTKLYYLWEFFLADKPHKVELFHSIVSGKKKLCLDAQVLTEHKSYSADFNYSFKLEKNYFNVTQIDSDTFNLKIDNKLFATLAQEVRKTVGEGRGSVSIINDQKEKREKINSIIEVNPKSKYQEKMAFPSNLRSSVKNNFDENGFDFDNQKTNKVNVNNNDNDFGFDKKDVKENKDIKNDSKKKKSSSVNANANYNAETINKNSNIINNLNFNLDDLVDSEQQQKQNKNNNFDFGGVDFSSFTQPSQNNQNQNNNNQFYNPNFNNPNSNLNSNPIFDPENLNNNSNTFDNFSNSYSNSNKNSNSNNQKQLINSVNPIGNRVAETSNPDKQRDEQSNPFKKQLLDSKLVNLDDLMGDFSKSKPKESGKDYEFSNLINPKSGGNVSSYGNQGGYGQYQGQNWGGSQLGGINSTNQIGINNSGQNQIGYGYGGMNYGNMGNSNVNYGGNNYTGYGYMNNNNMMNNMGNMMNYGMNTGIGGGYGVDYQNQNQKQCKLLI